MFLQANLLNKNINDNKFNNDDNEDIDIDYWSGSKGIEYRLEQTQYPKRFNKLNGRPILRLGYCARHSVKAVSYCDVSCESVNDMSDNSKIANANGSIGTL